MHIHPPLSSLLAYLARRHEGVEGVAGLELGQQVPVRHALRQPWFMQLYVYLM